MDNIETNEGRGIKTTNTVFDIIEYLHRGESAGVTEIADELGIAKGTVHSHLVTLHQRRYVIKESDDRYSLGLRFLNLGGAQMAAHELYGVAKPVVNNLADETGETAQVAVEEHGLAHYLYQQRGRKAVKTDSHLGSERHLHSTAVGKAILAYLDDPAIEAVIDRHGLPAFTEHTITERDELQEELQSIRDLGIAFDRSEQIDGIQCVAAPIVENGSAIGALSVAGPTKRVSGSRFEDSLPETVKRSARIIEIDIQNS
jgi:DNA-binding IclR family transcriptional regulator